MKKGKMLGSLMHTERVYGTLTIFGEVTSTHTAVMMAENHRTLGPVHTRQVYQEILLN